MPQLVKGGKWVFGWCITGSTCQIQIPPQACTEYGFKPGERVLILRGSRCSGGVSLGRPEKIEKSLVKLRVVGETTIENNAKIKLPNVIEIKPGERLLAVRGSGLALGFLQFGPIYEEALKHPEIESFYSADKL
jgi:hypothetical protein